MTNVPFSRFFDHLIYGAGGRRRADGVFSLLTFCFSSYDAAVAFYLIKIAHESLFLVMIVSPYYNLLTKGNIT